MKISRMTSTVLVGTIAVAGLSLTGGAAHAASDELPTCDQIWGSGAQEITDNDGDGHASPGDTISFHATVENATAEDVDMSDVSVTYTDGFGGDANYTLEGSSDTDVLEPGGSYALSGEHTIEQGDFGRTDPVVLQADGWEVPGHDCRLVLDRIAFEGDLSLPEPDPKDVPEPQEPPADPDEDDNPIVDTGYTGSNDAEAASLAGAALLLAGGATLGSARLRRKG